MLDTAHELQGMLVRLRLLMEARDLQGLLEGWGHVAHAATESIRPIYVSSKWLYEPWHLYPNLGRLYSNSSEAELTRLRSSSNVVVIFSLISKLSRKVSLNFTK